MSNKVDFSFPAPTEVIRKQFIRELNWHADQRNAEFVEALRREGKTKRELMAERLAELIPQWEACHYSDPPCGAIDNLIEAVEEYLDDNN